MSIGTAASFHRNYRHRLIITSHIEVSVAYALLSRLKYEQLHEKRDARFYKPGNDASYVISLHRSSGHSQPQSVTSIVIVTEATLLKLLLSKKKKESEKRFVFYCIILNDIILGSLTFLYNFISPVLHACITHTDNLFILS